MRLKPRQLEAFRHVMLTRGVTAASDAMNIAQPAVSRLIRDLESEVGMTLFTRQGGRLLPTPEAVLLLAEVERLYIGIDQVARAAGDIRQHLNVVLRIASVTSLVRPFLHQALVEIVGPRLDLPLVMDVENSRHIWDMVEKSHYDLGLVFGPPRPSDLQTVHLHSSTAVAAMPPDHPLAQKDVITPADLLDCRVLTAGRNSPLRRGLDRAFSQADQAPLNTVETSMLNCCHFAAAGMGVAIVDRITMRAADVELCAKPFLPTIDVSYYAARPAGSRQILVLDQIVERIKTLLDEEAVQTT
ncbi:LysR family transcriptional regulator [Tianweitania sp. BSSL-BM11]|uniref:LysR family transcriptional regulator n=1 Tax=Tianweitania aestuarii TaxID=2814886 RepID=A0ABS5S0H8_9HYPH|nr:LysR substrate-binding domain-containing protein [Tianweitania aestuarii]MBS9722057.1 LysR family transcriptional regulator [Tianweitania aestuarii]